MKFSIYLNRRVFVMVSKNVFTTTFIEFSIRIAMKTKKPQRVKTYFRKFSLSADQVYTVCITFMNFYKTYEKVTRHPAVGNRPVQRERRHKWVKYLRDLKLAQKHNFSTLP